MRTSATLIVLLFIAEPSYCDEKAPIAKQYNALLEQYQQEGGTRVFARQFLTLAEQHPQDPAAVDALLWVVKRVRGNSDTTRALELLRKYHINSEKLETACEDIANSRSVAAEKVLRAAMNTNPHQAVRAQACYYFAALLSRESELLEQLRAEPDLAPRVLQYYGKEYGTHLSSLDTAELTKRREQIYTRMQESFPELKIQDTTMGKIAERELFAIRRLSVGRPAPEIVGEDIHGKQFKLSDYRGKVVMLTFWGHW